jgi:hypothetical protein
MIPLEFKCMIPLSFLITKPGNIIIEIVES